MMQALKEKYGALDGVSADVNRDWLWVSGNTYALRDELKADGLRWSRKRSAWYLPSERKAEEKAESALVTKKADIENIIETNLTETYKGSKDYLIKSTSAILPLACGLVLFEMQRIETRFCFGEHGYDFDEVNETCEKLSKSKDYFKSENMRHYDGMLEHIDSSKCRTVLCKERSGNMSFSFVSSMNCHFFGISFDQLWNKVDNEPWNYNGVEYRFATDEEREQIRAGIKEERARFDKRLNTYLKRYGLSKCRFWTYWADR